MTAIVLPDIDKSTVDELLKKIPNLRAIELPAMPKMDKVSKTADHTLDRLLGRSKAPVWPWVAAGIGLVAVIGAVAAYFAFWRKPAWDTANEPWTTSTSTMEDSAFPTSPASSPSSDVTSDGTGLTAAEASLTSSSFNPQET